MEEYEIQRAATRLNYKYGKKALPKAVEVAKYYLGERDDEAAKRWIRIGYAVKKIQGIESVQEVVSSVNKKELEEV